MQALTQHKIQWITNLALALFFLFSLTIKGGYNLGFLLIGVGLFYLGYYFIAKKQKWSLSSSDKTILISFIFYFILFAISMLINDGKSRELDNPSRAVLVLPIILLLLNHSIRTKLLLHILPISAFIAGLTAIFQRFYLHWDRAFANQMSIQGGDIAMSLAMFSLISTFYFAIKKDYKFTALYFLCSLMGILGSVLSTARGAWIGLPFILIGILFVYRKFLTKKFFVSISISIIALLTIAISLPQTQMMQRIKQAQSDITNYIEKNNSSTSIGGRFDMWESALIMAQEKPLFGWGTKGVVDKRKQLADEKVISEYATVFDHAHNQFLDDLSKRGILGLMALLGIFFVPLAYFRKGLKSADFDIKTLALLGSVHIVSVMFYSLSQGFFSHNSGSIFYFLVTVLFYGLLRAKLEEQHQRPN